jgi:hypothetical protein
MQYILTPYEMRRLMRWRKPSFQIIVVDVHTGFAARLSRKGEKNMYKHPVDRKLKVTIVAPIDVFGNVAKIEGKPQITVEGAEEYGQLQVAEDGRTAEFICSGKITAEGVGLQVRVVGDANLDPDVTETINGSGEFGLEAGKAVGFQVGFSDGGPA